MRRKNEADRSTEDSLEQRLEQVSTDTGQAKVVRKEAERTLAELKAQREEVEALVRRLQRRREQNHFGRDLSVTFVRRGGNTDDNFAI